MVSYQMSIATQIKQKEILHFFLALQMLDFLFYKCFIDMIKYAGLTFLIYLSITIDKKYFLKHVHLTGWFFFWINIGFSHIIFSLHITIKASKHNAIINMEKTNLFRIKMYIFIHFVRAPIDRKNIDQMCHLCQLILFIDQ